MTGISTQQVQADLCRAIGATIEVQVEPSVLISKFVSFYAFAVPIPPCAVAAQTPTSAVISLFLSPAAEARTMRARSAKACGVLALRVSADGEGVQIPRKSGPSILAGKDQVRWMLRPTKLRNPDSGTWSG